MSTRAPIHVACALIERDGRLLVAQRPPGKSLALKWEFPGGKLEHGESGPDALAREIREELGLEIDVGRALPRVTHDYGTFTIVLHPYVCRVRAGEAHPHEHVDVRWCAPEEVAKLDLAAADVPVLAAYRPAKESFGSAWIDALAFAGGLALAWHLKWETRDLVWSLWLSSLLVGYATILIGCLVRPLITGGVAAAVGGLFLVAFFTFHFGMFHFVHSVFLGDFFPLLEGESAAGPFGLSFGFYTRVVIDYWPFVLVAAVAERAQLAEAVRAFTPGRPYVNVMRMHLLIFFFAGTHALGLESFGIYAVVYAVYFFPWRLLQGRVPVLEKLKTRA